MSRMASDSSDLRCNKWQITDTNLNLSLASDDKKNYKTNKDKDVNHKCPTWTNERTFFNTFTRYSALMCLPDALNSLSLMMDASRSAMRSACWDSYGKDGDGLDTRRSDRNL